jgi:hypothetical protein
MISSNKIALRKKYMLIINQLRLRFRRVGSSMLRLAAVLSLIFAAVSIATPAQAAVPATDMRGVSGPPTFTLENNGMHADGEPPPLPASFFGQITFSPIQPAPGTVVEARVPGVAGAIATTVIVLDGSSLVYSLDVPGDIAGTPAVEGGTEGVPVTFSIGGIDAAIAPWHSGTHTALNLSYSNNPPPLPASFYGQIHFSPTPPSPGTVIEARIPGVGVIATTVVLLDGSNLVYSLDIPGDNPGTVEVEGAAEGAQITFSVGGIDAAMAPWHSGTHTLLDLIFSNNPPPLPSSFFGEIHIGPTPPAPGTVIEARIPSISGVVAATVVVQLGASLVYSLDIAGDDPGTPAIEGGVEGDLITFRMGGRAVATAPWHAGTHTRLDFNFFELILQPGWNLVSFNLHPANTEITQVLASIAGSYDQVYAWNATRPNQNWLSYSPFVPPIFNNLTALDEKIGFWINITTQVPVTLTVSGSVPTTTTINLSTTAGGWNLVGFPVVVGRIVPDALPGPVSQIFAYHPGDAQPWKIFDRAMPPFLNTITSLTPGWGYWMYTTAPVTWEITYP